MKKIPTLFRRDPDDQDCLLREVHPACQWVIDGEGVALHKADGTCMLLDDDRRWWARRQVKPGKTAPPEYAAYIRRLARDAGIEPARPGPKSSKETDRG